jgi:hypothetical protein
MSVRGRSPATQTMPPNTRSSRGARLGTRLPRAYYGVDLIAPYSNHLDNLKTVQIVLARTGLETSITDEPDLGLLAVGNPEDWILKT